MNAYLNSISGIDDAIVSMYFSKRHMDRQIEFAIRDLCKRCLTRSGFIDGSASDEDKQKFDEYMKKLCKFGKHHITLLRFVDMSFTVYGLHRAGQDDWDAHACRYNNRIIRESSRLADFKEGEKSDYYKDKILTTEEAMKELNIQTPEFIIKDDVKYVKAVNGYIREDLADKNDVKRGLYMLSIPSSFIFRVNLTEWAHVYKERNKNGGANPEVKELAESIADMIERVMPYFNRELFMDIKN